MPKIKLRRGLETNLPILDEGEPGFTTDTKTLFIGSSDSLNVKFPNRDDLLAELAGVNADAEIISARGTYPTIGQRLDDVDVSLIQRSINVQYPLGTSLTPLKGDGSDETTAIQAFFTYAQTIGNVKLYFPDGTYCISNYIQPYKNTTVILHPNAVIKRIGSYYKMFANGTIGNAAYASGGYNGDGNIHFIGGTFDLNCQVGTTSPLPANQTVEFFALGHAENITFYGITVKNGQIGHYFEVSSCKNVRFKDCWFGAINYTGIGGSDYDYECIQIEVATADSFPSFGSYDLTISRDIYIENCTFDGVIRAVGTHSDGQYGTANTIFCENISFKENVIVNAYDTAIHLTGTRYSKIKNNTILQAGAYGISELKVEDSEITDNLILNTQKSGLYRDTSKNNKYRGNIIKDVALLVGGSYSAIRSTNSGGGTFDDNTVATTGTPQFTYAQYSDTTDATNPDRIQSHKYTKGTTAVIGGSTAADMANYTMGDGQTVLMDTNTDLGAVGNTFTFPHDIRNFNFLVVMGNNNSSATAQLVSMIIPKSAITASGILGTTSRFRLVTTDSASSNIVEFSFPTGTSIQVDVISGVGHIRKVIGVI